LPTVDPRLTSALAEQLLSWRAALADGHERVGWKLGMGDRERIGSGPVIGHLTSATRLADGASYATSAGVDLHADAEVAIELARDVGAGVSAANARAAIGAYGAALELVDLGPVPGGPEGVVATNIFHRAVAFGPRTCRELPDGVEGRLSIAGEVRDSARASGDYGALVQWVARILGEVDEQLHAGDLVITGSVVQVPVQIGDHVVADLGELGRAELSVIG
jgi:2-keto-4-pentenoate hydratase